MNQAFGGEGLPGVYIKFAKKYAALDEAQCGKVATSFHTVQAGLHGMGFLPKPPEQSSGVAPGSGAH